MKYIFRGNDNTINAENIQFELFNQLTLSISNTLYLELSLYLELKSRSLCVDCNLFFSPYLEQIL